MPHPDYAYNKKRNQYHSTAILKTLMEEREYEPSQMFLKVNNWPPSGIQVLPIHFLCQLISHFIFISVPSVSSVAKNIFTLCGP